MKKEKAENNVLEHTQAKLDLYKKYLECYLLILCNVPYFKQINLFDVFCGEGVYSAGKIGSAMITLDCIRTTNQTLQNNNVDLKTINLFLNDLNVKKVEKVKGLTAEHNIPNLSIHYSTEDAGKQLKDISNRLTNTPRNQRNLVFIDPYGYSAIKKEDLYNIVKNGLTEVILFLPINQMYRFIDVAISEESRRYEKLNDFIKSFFSDSAELNTLNQLSFIQSIKEAITFKHQFHSCKYYIERGAGCYYALFFICSNILGLEKQLESIWSLNPVKGKGYDKVKSPNQLTLFQEELNDNDYIRTLKVLEDIFHEELKKATKLNNNQIYKITLLNEYLPKHAKEALVNMQEKGEINIQKTTKGFGINNENYKNGTIITEFYFL